MNEGKALLPIKAQPLDDAEAEDWLQGKRPRRLLVMPFGGPIPAAKAPRGVDLDGEWFSERTDRFGPFEALKATRERPVDFMHGFDSSFKTEIVGQVILDEEPEEDGLWADLWLKAQKRRIDQFRALIARGVTFFGSSQAAFKKADPDTGEILVWPYYIQTLAPTPQNIYSVVRPAKAVLDDLYSSGVHTSAAFKAFLADLDASTDLPLTSAAMPGDAAAKAGRVLSALNEQALRDLAALLDEFINSRAQRPSHNPTEGDAST